MADKTVSQMLKGVGQRTLLKAIAGAEWQENVAANKLTQAQAKAQADIEAARKSSKTTRREWEKAKGKKWPQDKGGSNYDADHKKALADGGSNNAARYIQPRTRRDHINRHKKNGDFRRWAKRRKKRASQACGGAANSYRTDVRGQQKRHAAPQRDGWRSA